MLGRNYKGWGMGDWYLCRQDEDENGYKYNGYEYAGLWMIIKTAPDNSLHEYAWGIGNLSDVWDNKANLSYSSPNEQGSSSPGEGDEGGEEPPSS